MAGWALPTSTWSTWRTRERGALRSASSAFNSSRSNERKSGALIVAAPLNKKKSVAPSDHVPYGRV